MQFYGVKQSKIRWTVVEIKFIKGEKVLKIWGTKNPKFGLKNLERYIMQVCVDVTCMYTDFDGRGLFDFGDTATLKNGQISLSDHGL